jgi:stearoyl-CoA desaturase (delta-9 desaturase)
MEKDMNLFAGKHGTLALGALPFLLLQLSVLLVFTTHFSWTGLGLCILCYGVRMFAITGFYHRYFSHRTYAMGRTMQFLGGFAGATATQRGPLWWAAHHRQHHKSSDTEEDPHNSHEGFWHAHWLWFLYQETSVADYGRVPELVRYPELIFLDRCWYVPPVLMGAALFAVGGWHWVVWGYFVSTFLLSNGTYTINSLMHYWGRKRFYTGDESRNHWLLALVTLGEGWHNNHHRYQASTRNGFFWYEIDPTYYLLKLMSLAGLVRDLKPVPEKIMEEARLNRYLGREARSHGASFSPKQVGVRDLLVQMPFAAQGFVAESLSRVRRDMQGLGRLLAERGEELGADVQALSRQVAERGRQLGQEIRTLADQGQGTGLRVDLQGWGAQVAEQGRHLRGEVEALSAQVAEQGRHLRGEVEALSAQVSERGRHLRGEVEALSAQVTERGQALRREVETLSEEVGETARHLVAEMEALSQQVAETIGHLCGEAEALGAQVAERGRHLRGEVETLSEEVGETARHLAAEMEAWSAQVSERGRHLRGEVEAWSGLLPHMA